MRSPAADPPSTNATPRPPLATVEECLGRIDAEGPRQLATDALRDDIRWFAIQQRALEAMSARWLAELDRREREAGPDPVNSCVHWLQDTLHLTNGAAYGQVRNARRLEQLPRTAAALRRGELSAQHLGVLCQAMDQVHRTSLDPTQVETALLEAARGMDPRQLLDHWRQLRYRADQPAGLEAEDEQRRRRWLTLRETWSGSFRIEGELDPENGSALRTAIQAMVPTRRRRAPDDDRTPDQMRVDAVGDLARFRLEAGDLPERGGERPQMMVVADLATLRLEPGSQLAQMDWGPLVSGETARRIGCDTSVTPVLVDANGEILHVGRRSRTVPAPTRRALNLRDRHCQWAGCRMPASTCTPHHAWHWADGGGHELDNLSIWCDRHHALLHPENARFRRASSGGPGP